MEVPSSATVFDIITELGIPVGHISFCTVNGDRKDFSCAINPGDEVVIFPYVIGG